MTIALADAIEGFLEHKRAIGASISARRRNFGCSCSSPTTVGSSA